MYEIIVQHPAEQFIKQLPKEKQTKLLDAIESLAENPRKGSELTGKLSGLRSLHVDVYRVIYKIEEQKLIVLVLNAGHRSNIYSKKIDN